MMNKEHKKSALQQKSLQQQPFRVPEGYFDNFPDRLKERIGKLDEKKVPERSLGRSVRFRIAMAAAIIGLAFAVALARFFGGLGQ